MINGLGWNLLSSLHQDGPLLAKSRNSKAGTNKGYPECQKCGSSLLSTDCCLKYDHCPKCGHHESDIKSVNLDLVLQKTTKSETTVHGISELKAGDYVRVTHPTHMAGHVFRVMGLYRNVVQVAGSYYWDRAHLKRWEPEVGDRFLDFTRETLVISAVVENRVFFTRVGGTKELYCGVIEQFLYSVNHDILQLVTGVPPLKPPVVSK